MSANKILQEGKSMLRRINGLSGWGVQWANGADPRVEIKKLIDELSFRRVLFNNHSCEIPKETVMSVLEIRRHIVDTVKNVKTGTDTHKLLTIMARACLNFLDDRSIENDYTCLETALDKLRTVLGASLLVLSEAYGLSLQGEIARILPAGVNVPALKAAMVNA